MSASEKVPVTSGVGLIGEDLVEGLRERGCKAVSA